MYKLPDISGETELVRNMLTDDREGPEIAKDYGIGTKLLNERMRNQRTFWLDMDNMTNEELVDAINTIGGTIDKQARWFKIKPKVFRNRVFIKLMSDSEFIKAYSEDNFLPEDFSDFIGVPEFITRETMKCRAIRLKARRSKSFNPSMMKRRFYDFPERKLEAQEKREATMMERYGVPTPLKNREILDKTIETVKVRYGSTTFLTSDTFKNLDITSTKSNGVEESEFVKSVIYTLGNKHKYTRNVRLSDMGGLEFDLLIDDNVAIEFNGMYWHSSKHESRIGGYHLNKYRKASDLGIRVLTIWESNWRTIKGKQKVLADIKRLICPDKFTNVSISDVDLVINNSTLVGRYKNDIVLTGKILGDNLYDLSLVSEDYVLDGTLQELLSSIGIGSITLNNDFLINTGLGLGDISRIYTYTKIVENYLNSGFDVEPSGWTLYKLP